MHNRLRALRTEHNWSQASLAERLGVSRQTVNALEAGKYDPSLPLAFKIAELFGIAIETIFFLEEESMFARKFFGGPESGGPSPNDIPRGLFRDFTEPALRVIQLAQVESRRLGHNFVGTEQILLGILGEATGLAAQLLLDQGITLEDARHEVEKIIGRGSRFVAREIPFTPRAKRALALAGDAAEQFRFNSVGAEQLLLGLIRENSDLRGGGVAVRVLEILGIDLSALEQQLLALVQDAAPEASTPAQPLSWASKQAKSTERLSDLISGEISVRLSTSLMNWVSAHQLGRVISNAGFQAPTGEILTPYLCFFARERLKRAPRIYPELAPDLVVEIKSAFDRKAPLREQIQQFLDVGVQVGLIIDPDEQTVTIYRTEQEEVVLKDGDILTLPELLDAWQLPISQLWPPVFG